MRRPERGGTRRYGILLGAVLFVTSLDAAPAGAQRCLESLRDGEVRARIDSIERALARQERPARAWWYGWTFGLMVIGVGQTVGAFLLDDRGDAAATATGAVGSFAGVISMLVQPLPSVDAADRIARAPDGTPTERRAKLALAQRLLEQSASRQKRGRSAIQQVPLVPWIVSAGLLLGIRYKETQGWFRLAVGSVLVLEARILTQPTAAIAASEAYEYGSRPCMAPELREPRPRIRVELAGAPGGLGLALRF